jgi:hypothetical protein
MKKDRTARKLQLRRETLHPLDMKTLVLVLGGQQPVETIVRPSDACPVPTSK